jgi:uncharacterized membrane protein YqjE
MPYSNEGIYAASRRLMATVLDIGQVRLSLIGTELELEKRRFFDGLLWGGIALMVLGVGTALLCGLVVMMVAEGHRLIAMGVLTLFFLLLGIFLLLTARQRLRGSGGTFDHSVAELQQDRVELCKPTS